MQTLYIDVYFLINFTVDVLAVYFAVLLSKITTSRIRLILCGLIGAISACLTVILELNTVFYVINLLFSVLIIVLIASGRASFIKQLKIFISFLFFETFLGGLITFTYGILDKYLSPLFKDEVFGVENKNLLVISSVILLALGILKLVFYIFSGVSTEKNVDFSFELFGSKYDLTGLVDSGNLLKDPMTLKPVIIVKSKVFKGKFKDLASDVLYTSDQELKGRIRLIPVKGFGGNRLLIGIKSEICLKNNNCNSQTVIAIDEEEGSFGGYDALIPSELVSN